MTLDLVVVYSVCRIGSVKSLPGPVMLLYISCHEGDSVDVCRVQGCFGRVVSEAAQSV